MKSEKQTVTRRRKNFPVMLLGAARAELFALDAIDRAEFIAALDDFEEYGPSSPRVDTKKIQGEMFEIKTQTPDHWLRGFYFHFHEGLWIITHIFAKKTNKAPKADIAIGIARYKEFIREHSSQILEKQR